MEEEDKLQLHNTKNLRKNTERKVAERKKGRKGMRKERREK